MMVRTQKTSAIDMTEFDDAIVLRDGAGCHGAHLLRPCHALRTSAQDPQLDPRSLSQLAAHIHTGDSFLSLACARASAMSARTNRLLYL